MSHKSTDMLKEIETWTKHGEIGKPCDDSTEVLEELKLWINAGDVRFESESNKYYRLLGGKYPIGVNRIDWRGVQKHLVMNVFPPEKSALTGEEKEQVLRENRHIVLEWFHSYGIDLKKEVVWTGDTTEISLHMTIKTLLELYPLLFSWPQHHYVLPLTGEWCLNYTMEGQLFFGKAENALAHGYVDLDSP